MRVLVTGSEGFVGKNLVERLLADGHEVVPYDEKIDRPTESYWIEQEPFDVCFHLACMNQMRATQFPQENLEVNAMDTRLMAEEARNQGAKFIYTSTASVYGNAKTIPTPVTEQLNPLTDYAVAKLAGEYFVKNSGADWTILRLSNVYGPHQTLDNPYCGVIGRFIEASLAGKPMQIIGDGQQTRDFSFVGDVVEHLVQVGIHRREKGVFNVSSGVETSIYDLATIISAQTDHPLYESDQNWVSGVPARPIDSIERRCLVPDLRCETDLDFGIEKTVDWFLPS